MKRVLMVVSYDGTAYHGWQIQPNGNTIEAELNKALSELLGEEITVSGASRTDAGVHALCNLAVFDTNARMPGEKISFAVNQRLPWDIRVRKSAEVPADFHPRYCDTVKTYEYRIFSSRFPLPTRRLYTYFSHYSYDIDRMREAGACLVGEHDFRSFCSVRSTAETTVRTITDLQVLREGEEIVIRVSGTGFLYNMVRIIAGTLMEAGRGAYPPSEVKAMLEGCDRGGSGDTAPACGLTLVRYRFMKDEWNRLIDTGETV